MMTPHQVSLNNFKILNIIHFQILKVETFIQICLPCLLLFELSTCKSCFVSYLNKNSLNSHKLVTSTILLWDHALHAIFISKYFLANNVQPSALGCTLFAKKYLLMKIACRAWSHNSIVLVTNLCELREFLFKYDTKHDLHVDSSNSNKQGKQICIKVSTFNIWKWIMFKILKLFNETWCGVIIKIFLILVQVPRNRDFVYSPSLEINKFCHLVSFILTTLPAGQ